MTNQNIIVQSPLNKRYIKTQRVSVVSLHWSGNKQDNEQTWFWLTEIRRSSMVNTCFTKTKKAFVPSLLPLRQNCMSTSRSTKVRFLSGFSSTGLPVLSHSSFFIILKQFKPRICQTSSPFPGDHFEFFRFPEDHWEPRHNQDHFL